MALKKSIYRKEIKNKVGVDFSSLSETTVGTNNRSFNNIIKPGKVSKPQPQQQTQQLQNSDIAQSTRNTTTNKVSLQKSNYTSSDDDEEYIDL